MAESKDPKKPRAPKHGKRITVTLSDEHYQAVINAAKADDREPNVYLSRILREHLSETLPN